MNRFVSREVAFRILLNIQRLSLSHIYEPDKHRLILTDEHKNYQAYFRLPIVIPPPEKIVSPDTEEIHYVIVLIQSGSCALGYYENGKNLEHKVFRSYM